MELLLARRARVTGQEPAHASREARTRMVSIASLIEHGRGKLHYVFLCFDPPVNGQRCASILVRLPAAITVETLEAAAVKGLQRLSPVERECASWVIVHAPSNRDELNAYDGPPIRFRHRRGHLFKAEIVEQPGEGAARS
jgi:hypothetical protein